MRALQLATVAVLLSVVTLHASNADAQILDTGEGRCGLCGHSERDTQRYVNSFLNQMFFPRTGPKRAFVAANLYLLTATFKMYGNRSPDRNFASVTIAITAEVKSALPTGNYRVTVTTPGGKTSTDIYAIGDTRFRVIGRLRFDEESSSSDVSGLGRGGRSGPPASGSGQARERDYRPARCTRSRRQDLSMETILWCSAD